MADQVQREGERAGGDARTAPRNDRPVERHPGIAEQARQIVGALQLPVLGSVTSS